MMVPPFVSFMVGEIMLRMRRFANGPQALQKRPQVSSHASQNLDNISILGSGLGNF